MQRTNQGDTGLDVKDMERRRSNQELRLTVANLSTRLIMVHSVRYDGGVRVYSQCRTRPPSQVRK